MEKDGLYFKVLPGGCTQFFDFVGYYEKNDRIYIIFESRYSGRHSHLTSFVYENEKLVLDEFEFLGIHLDLKYYSEV